MKHPGPYQKIAMDRRSFMPINTESRMARQLDDEWGKDEKYQEYQKYEKYQNYHYQREKGKKRRNTKPGGDWRKPPVGSRRHSVAQVGTSKREGGSQGLEFVGLKLHGFYWHKVQYPDSALAGRIDIA
jgi:hypothetical protein